MQSFVFMTKHTGELLEGWRIMFVDNGDEPLDDLGLKRKFTVVLIEHQSWLLYHPRMGPAPVHFNLKGVEKIFENLGEL